TSGYCHAKTDLWTVHTYEQNPALLAEKLNTQPIFMREPDLETPAWNGQPYLVDEYGGVSFVPEGKKPFAANSWGYNKDTLSREETERRITDLTRCLVDDPRVAGYCYTQLTDVEQEQNGIYGYDRSEKFDMEAIRECFSYKPGWSRL
ncbi:MAG: beta-glucuronidase, partial [Lentisphaeria bacterium]|nr:beta-glucuronidase [Lentisphaeria bacterium]